MYKLPSLSIFCNYCLSVLHGESSKRLATPRNAKDKITYNQPNRPNRHTPQTKHKALPKGQACLSVYKLVRDGGRSFGAAWVFACI